MLTCHRGGVSPQRTRRCISVSVSASYGAGQCDSWSGSQVEPTETSVLETSVLAVSPSRRCPTLRPW